MKHLLTFLLLAGMLLGLGGCRLNYMEPEEMRNFLDGVVENIGSSQITDDDDLIGERLLVDDDGHFETTLKLESGGNYIMAIYEDFSGTLEMTCEYIDEEK